MKGLHSRVRDGACALAADSAKLLVVDDDLVGRAMLSQGLAHSGYAVEVALDRADALEKIRTSRYDLILLDHSRPGRSGLDLLALLRATFSSTELPVIVVTGSGQDSEHTEVLERGANDCIAKPLEFPMAAARIESQISRARVDRQAKYNDPLTGLDNRASLLDRLESALESGNQSGAVALLLLNLDGFKLLNASFGQRAGDQLLVSVANRLRVAFGNAALARIGDDEFAILIENTMANEEAQQASVENSASVAIACFGSPFFFRETSLTMTASVGGTWSGAKKSSADSLWREAEIAMRRAKEVGKNCWKIFDRSLRERLQARASLGLDLRRAVERNELVAYYQPKVHLPTRTIVGFEALLRWKHSERGLVPPNDFISIAEELGLIVTIGGWILDEACRQLKAWQQEFAHGDMLSMNVNVSVKQLYDPSLIARVEAILTETGIHPANLKLELTESSLMTEIHSVRDTLARLRALGVGLKLDDFGTGYSSLNYLRDLHFDSLKIDRSFINKITSDIEAQTIVATIINLAHALSMKVVAEGIETEEQMKKLIELGCDTGQGYLFSRPVPAESAARLLHREPRAVAKSSDNVWLRDTAARPAVARFARS